MAYIRKNFNGTRSLNFIEGLVPFWAMAGHSKWANTKHRKGRADAVKGKIFTRVTKEIISAVKQGGPDPKSNPKLRLVMDKARAANMPNDNVERNIKKASSADQSDYF